jgi:hypothetical protein
MRNRKGIEARFRLELLLQFEKMVGKKPFDQLSIVKLSEKMGISKVTFYNVYFSRKEDVLTYYFQVWCLRLTADLLGFFINTQPQQVDQLKESWRKTFDQTLKGLQ